MSDRYSGIDNLPVWSQYSGRVWCIFKADIGASSFDKIILELANVTPDAPLASSNCHGSPVFYYQNQRPGILLTAS